MDHDYSLSRQGPSRNGYRKGCRCEECLVLGRKYLEERRAREARRRNRPPEEVETHGVSGYQRGCRCAECLWDVEDARQAQNYKRNPPSPPDWSAVDHLRPGAGVKRRSRAV